MNRPSFLRFIVAATTLVVSMLSFGADGQLKPGEFPPRGSAQSINGKIETLDFIHRTGQFRTAAGELHDFAMPPYGTASYLGTEADLRHIPLGTRLQFFLFPDSHGELTRLATLQDQFTVDATEGVTYHLDELILADGKLLATRQVAPKNQPDLRKRELAVSNRTRVWKGKGQAQLSDLAIGDALLFNFDGNTDVCSEIWAGAEAQKLATETQCKKFNDFLKFRGLPGWIDKTAGQTLVVTLFSANSTDFKNTWMRDFAAGKEVSVVVANDELRSWNPPVDKERSTVDEVQQASTECYGCSGVRLVVTVKHMLEGFRRGRIVRIFGPGWPIKDMPFGEGIYTDLQTAEINLQTPKEFPRQFPFRTDYGNEHLPWYKLSSEVPPHFSAHRVLGELVKVDLEKKSGQFRIESTGEAVDFTLIKQGAVVQVNTNKIDDGGPARWNDSPAQAMYLNAVAGLEQLPLGLRYRFNLYQDENGKFTKVSLISDEFSYLATNKIVYRVDALRLAEGKLYVARQIPQKKNYNGDMVQPPDIGCAELRVDAKTRVWKGEQQVELKDIAIGDALLVNVTSEQPGKPSCCSDIWIGAETHAKVTEQQRKKQNVAKH